MRKYLPLVGVFLFALVLSGCVLTKSQPQLVDINVTLSGVLSKGVGENFTLKTVEGVKELHSAGASLDGFVGQTITVTGQYSGTTLYVDKIE